MSLVQRTALEFNDLDLEEIRKAHDTYKAWQAADSANPDFKATFEDWESRKAHLAFLLILKLTAFEARAARTAGGAQ